MNFLEEWAPMRELEKFRAEFDEMMDRFRSPKWFKQFESEVMKPRVESFTDDGKLTVRIDLPGIDPKDIEVSVTAGMLTIRAKREEKSEIKKRDFFKRELHYGAYERDIELPDGIKAEEIKAAYRDGVLELTAPLPRELAPKEVKVRVEGVEAKPEPKKVEAKEKSAA